MLRLVKWSVWSIILLGFFPTGLAAQNYVYTNNDPYNSPNSISGFSVDNGILCSTNDVTCLIGGQPFLTGGLGTLGNRQYSSTRIIVVKDFLYASNAGSNSISAFSIDPGTGMLTQLGTPISTNGSDGSSESGISLAATPDGTYLYAGTTDGTITVFRINNDNNITDPPLGGLTKVGSVSADGPMYSMKVSPDGNFLILPVDFRLSSPSPPDPSSPYGLDVFDIRTDKTLQSAPKSRLVFSPVPVTSVDINCENTLLFAGTVGTDIDVFTMDSTGALNEVAPITTSASSNQVVVLSPDGSALFSSNQGSLNFNLQQYTVTAFPLGMDGSLTGPETPVGAGASAFYTSGLAISHDGAFLYSADANGAISTFGVGGSTSLSLDSYTTAGLASGLRSLAAYPAKACASPPPSSSLTVNSLQISGGPPPAFVLDATLSLDSSPTFDPLRQKVTIQVGDSTSMLTLDLPPGSFKTFQDGRNAGTYLFQGVISSTTLKVQITPLGSNESGQNQFQIHAFDKQIDSPDMDGPVTVTVCIGDSNNCVSTDNVTPSFPSSLRGNWRDQ